MTPLFSRQGNSIEVTRKLYQGPAGEVVRDASGKLITDIDVIVSGVAYVQAKTAVSIMQNGGSAKVGVGTIQEARSWISTAFKDGADEVYYIIPDGGYIGPQIKKAIESAGAIVLNLPN